MNIKLTYRVEQPQDMEGIILNWKENWQLWSINHQGLKHSLTEQACVVFQSHCQLSAWFCIYQKHSADTYDLDTFLAFNKCINVTLFIFCKCNPFCKACKICSKHTNVICIYLSNFAHIFLNSVREPFTLNTMLSPWHLQFMIRYWFKQWIEHL